MKGIRLTLLAVAILLLTGAALADSVFDNGGGSISAISSGSLFHLQASSTLKSVTGVVGLDCSAATSPCAGSVSYKTGNVSLSTIDILSGSVSLPTTGSTFTIHENGSLVFSGTFTSLTWAFVGSVGANQYEWSLTGSISGTYLGNPVSGGTIQLTTISTGTNPFGSGGTDKINLDRGSTNLPGVVPESSSLLLFGTGLVGLALLVKRRYSA